MDFIVQLPITKTGYDAILVVVDRMSKRAHFLPTTTNATAPDVAKLFFNQIFRLHGLPQVIVSDRDPKFVSKFWQDLTKKLGTKLAMSTAHHPQTDGQTERMNRTLEDMLRAYVNYKQDNWDDCLAAAEFAYNQATQASTGFSPFKIDCGQEPLVPSAFLDPTMTTSQVASTENFLVQWQNTITMAKDSLLAAQDRQARNANRHRQEDSFNVGDQVLLSTAHLQIDAEKRRPLRKLQAKFVGPYIISSVISPTAYKLDLPATMHCHPVFHISLLRRHHPAPQEFASRVQAPPPPIRISGQDSEYEVQAILDKRTYYRKIQYLVHWKGYPAYDATWEPLDNLKNAQDMIVRFENSV